MNRNLLLIKIGTLEQYRGFSYRELISQITGIKFNDECRRLIMFGCMDTVSFSKEFNELELDIQKAERAITLLIRDYNFELYLKETK